MRELQGLSASPGIAVGTVCLYAQGVTKEVPHYGISEEQLPNELKRLAFAFNTIKESLIEKREIAENVFGEQGKEILEAHFSILNDPQLREKIRDTIKNERINAEHAISVVFDGYIDNLSGQGTRLEELSYDVKAIKEDLLAVFLQDETGLSCPVDERQPIIVATDRLDPSVVLSVDTEKILAFVSREGGYTSHATILARTRNIPIVFGIDVSRELKTRDTVVVDGTLGKVFVSPDDKTKEFYRQKLKIHKERKELCIQHLSDPPSTTDGTRIFLKVNISTEGEMELLKNSMHEEGNGRELFYDGIGLLRTEFIYMGEKSPPDEDKQFSIYEKIVSEAEDRTVTVRVLDFTRDKLPSYLPIPANMDLDMEGRGARAIRIFKELYITQARALLRASAAGNVNILFPMVNDVNDILEFKGLIEEAEKGLERDGIEYGNPAIGIMFETPSSIMMAEELFEYIDFANLGTNDLLQFSVAASRADLRSQYMYHIMHPSVLKMITDVAQKGKKANKEVCLCGELASYENYYPILLDTGLTSFSVPASKYEDIKCELLHINMDDITGAVYKYLRAKNRQAQDQVIESLYRRNV